MKGAALLLLMAGVAFPLVVGYHVDPVSANQSGWTPWLEPNNYVSEIVTCCWDSLSYPAYVEGFFGARGGPDYQLTVYTYPGGTQVTYPVNGQYKRDYDWVRFDTFSFLHAESIVKGKRLEFRFTRTGQDSLEYFTRQGTEYLYGFLRTGGTRDAT